MAPPLTLPLKMLCRNPPGVQGFRAPATHPYNKLYTFLHPNPVSGDWLYCVPVSKPNFGSVNTRTREIQLMGKRCHTGGQRNKEGPLRMEGWKTRQGQALHQRASEEGTATVHAGLYHSPSR